MAVIGLKAPQPTRLHSRDTAQTLALMPKQPLAASLSRGRKESLRSNLETLLMFARSLAQSRTLDFNKGAGITKIRSNWRIDCDPPALGIRGKLRKTPPGCDLGRGFYSGSELQDVRW